MTCDVDGNPFPDITWYHEDKKVSTSLNLTLRVDQSNAGRYYCKAHVPGFQDIGAEAAIYLKGKFSFIVKCKFYTILFQQNFNHLTICVRNCEQMKINFPINLYERFCITKKNHLKTNQQK